MLDDTERLLPRRTTDEGEVRAAHGDTLAEFTPLDAGPARPAGAVPSRSRYVPLNRAPTPDGAVEARVPAAVAPRPRSSPVPGPPTSGRRRSLALAGGGAVTVLVAVVVALVVLRGSSDATTRGTVAVPGPESAPYLGVFTPPVTLADDTEYIRTTVLSSGSLRVTQWIHSAAPMSKVTVSVPSALGLDASAVRVRHLIVSGDGSLVTAVKQTGHVWQVPMPAAHNGYISYELSGVLDRSPSDPRRAIARLTALDVGFGTPVVQDTHDFIGARVRSLACASPGPHALPVPCGESRDGVWRVVLDEDSRRSQVLAQLDLG